jgi:hypothetical protein
VDFLASLWKQNPAGACTKADEAAARKWAHRLRLELLREPDAVLTMR